MLSDPNPFGTIVTAMVTPFDTEGELDLRSAAATARWLTQPGWNDGLVVNGTTGESATTSDSEKAELLSAVRQAAPTARLVAGVGSADTHHCVRLAQQAEAAGADALLLVTPYYVRPSQSGILTHFLAVADATSLPVMLYDIPKRSGVAIDHDTLVAAATHENVRALKDAKGDLEAASWVLHDTDLLLYSGDDALNLAFLAIGATGFVSVAGHVVAPELRALYDAYRSGRVGDASRIHRRLLFIYRGIFRAPGAASAKAALALLGVDAGLPRLPLDGLSPAELAALRDDVRLYRDLPA